MARKTKRKSAPSAARKKTATRRPAPAKAKRRASKPAAKAVRSAAPAWKPAGVQDVIVNLVSRNASGAMEFYKSAFGAKEEMRMMSPDGRAVWHAELRIGDSVFYINDAMPGGPNEAPGPSHKPTSTVQVYVPDVDGLFNRAVQAGATVVMPLEDQFWGDRMGLLTDPFGQTWGFSTRVKTLTMEQMRKAGEEFAAKMAQRHPDGGSPPGSAAQ